MFRPDSAIVQAQRVEEILATSTAGPSRWLAGGRSGPDGVAVVDKPAGWTSHDVVAKARGLLGTRKVGHSGTLDPDATGVLVLGVGRATRLLTFLSGLPKRYVGEVVLGTATTTLDASGEVTGTWDMSGVPSTRCAGRRPGSPATSTRCRRWCRPRRSTGAACTSWPGPGWRSAPPVRVRVDAFTVGEAVAPGVFPVEVACSAGTYVRLGGRSGHGAGWRRPPAGAAAAGGGPYDRGGGRPGRPGARAAAAPGRGPAGPPPAVVDRSRGAGGHGRVLAAAVLGAEGPGPWAVVDEAGALLAVYEPHREGTVKPAVVLAEPPLSDGPSDRGVT